MYIYGNVLLASLSLSLPSSSLSPQLVMGDEAVLTFGCSTFIEREEWTEAFRILNQLAPAFIGSDMSSRTPVKGNLH